MEMVKVKEYISCVSNIFVFSLIVILFLGCPTQNMCKNCDSSVSLVTGVICGIGEYEGEAPGYVSVTPAKSSYVIGERVGFRYVNINPDYVFLNWIGSPLDVNVSNILMILPKC